MSRSIYPITLVICIYLIVSPFTFMHGHLSPYELPKFILSIIAAQIIAIFLLFLNEKLELDTLAKLIFLFLTLNLLSNILGLDPRTSLFGSLWRYQGFLLLLCGIIFFLGSRTITKADLILKSLFFSSFTLSIISIIQFMLLERGHAIVNYNGRIIATLGNPNFLGAYLVTILPLILFYNFKNIYIKFIFASLLISAILMSQSKSAILAAGVSLIFYLFKITKGRKPLFILLTSVVIIFTLSSLNYFARSSIWDSRSVIWQGGIDALVNMPFTGYGQENFSLIFPKELNFHVDNAHNIFLETLISTGIIGLIFFVSILIVGFKKANPIIRISLISIIICGFFNPLFISGIILFWILLGISDKEFNFQKL